MINNYTTNLFPFFFFFFSFHFFSSTAGGETYRGGQFEGSQGGSIHYAPEPVYPQHQGGLPAECGLWVQTSNQEAANVHVLRDAHAPPAVSKEISPC